MPKVTKHVPVRRGFDTVWLSPGDDLPDWAVGLVGDHALSVDAPDVAEPVKAVVEEPAIVPVAAAPNVGAPDFTKPAPAKRGRPSKAE